MEGADASRSNGASPEARDARSPPGPNGSLENGTKADSKDTKTTNGHSGEVTEGKTLGSALKSGEGKSGLFSSNEWRRPIIQFVESVDDKGSSYFSMDSAEGRRSPYAGLQLGASKKPPVTFAEKGELRKSIFSEPRKPTVTIVEPGEARRNSYPRADSSLLLRSKSGSEEVLCDSCIGNKQKAVKSCLVCQASFCDLHLKPHLEGAAFRDHQLLEPIRDFEARKCPLHGKTMELFCQTDQTCICYLCMFQEHKNHSTVTVEEAKAEKETELSLQKEQLQLKIIEIEDEAEKWQKEKDRIKSFTTNEKAILEQNFRDLVRDLEKQKEEVRAALEQREQDAVDQVKVIVDALDERAKVLHEDKQTREQLHSISDSVLFLQEFGALMSNYSLPPPLPTYHVLLEGEGLGQSLGNCKDDLLNVCMRHVEKMCKADLSRNFIERNHMENGGDHRYMNNYTSSYGNEWSTPDTMKRYSMYLTPKGGGRTSYQPSSPNRLSKETNLKNFNNLYGTKGNYTSRVWEYSSTVQNADDMPTVQGNSSFSLKAGTGKAPYQFTTLGQATAEFSKPLDRSGLFKNNPGYPSLLRSQVPKAQPQTWKSGKQTLLSHYRPFYVNKGSGIGSNEAP
ncbi:tripartite motif protein 29 (predicted), isoform CRA_a [Rattus norvegicus]|uniref:Tripartite motif-containing protein 29 n=1 Tax=Rattus norvegicus TaxID=10116 RepID=A6J3U2_RAT|nr:tripartite motif protein 29 (predicted), isoform CRA_a [Rattus norvegicus]|eukprot:XP_017451037.1 PREDICTED: tripartite motif-containing protein 29 isoform X1 [Rattus norvegicus]